MRPGGRGVVPPVSVKDRAVVGPADKSSTSSLRKYRTASPPLRASRVVAEKWDAYVYIWWSHVELG